MFRFHDHSFDPDTGELDGPRESVRLQPKPARLLALLLASGGDLVDRDSIRAALWPDTNVDFDANLNTCVKQIRTALRETGDDTEYVETLPKRGYRITVAVEHEAEHAQPLAEPAFNDRPPSVAEWLPYVVMFIALTALTVWVVWGELFGYPDGFAGVGATTLSSVGAPADGAAAADAATTAAAPAAAPARLAIVPFVDPESDTNATFNRDLTEAFVAALVDAAPNDIVVVGPSTTALHFADGASLPDVATAVNADFVLHGGHRSSADIFFVEVVLPDGEHLFAQRMVLDLSAPAQAPADVVAAMTASMIEALGR